MDVTCWANSRGYGRFARELVRAMVAMAPEHQFLCFGDRRSLEAGALEAGNVRLVEVAQRVSPTKAAAADGNRAVTDLLRLTRAVVSARPDVFFSPSVYTYFPLPPGLRTVVTLHDAIADRFPQMTLPTRRARWFWRLKVGVALRQARIVLTVSDYAAEELTRVLGIPPARIRVAVEAPAAVFRPAEQSDIAAAAARAGLAPGDRWFTYVGGFSPHKRIDVIIRAHSRLAATLTPAPHLLLIGRQSGDAFLSVGADLRKLVTECGTGPLVRWTGFLPDEELRGLHSGAVASLLPSECEGFGLPAVEAAACGTPVVATTESPLPVLLEGGGFFVAPGAVNGLAEAMRRLATDEPARLAMGRIAAERAGRLSWDAAARTTLDALLEAAA